MNRSKVMVVLAVGVLVVLGAWLILAGSDSTVSSESDGAASTEGDEAAGHASRSSDSEDKAGKSMDAGVARAVQEASRVTKADTATLLSRIVAARERRQTLRRTDDDDEVDEAPDGRIEAEYLRSAIEELKPLLTECVSESQVPSIAGKLMVEFFVTGEPEVGGVIESSEIVESSLVDEAGEVIENEELMRCFQESIYTLQLPPPENGGRLKVTYPFQLEKTPQGE